MKFTAKKLWNNTATSFTAKPLKGKLTVKIQQLLLGQDWSVSYDIPMSRSIIQATKIRHYNVECKNKTVRHLAWWVATNTDIHMKTVEGPPFGPSKLDTRRLQINTDHKGLGIFKSLIVFLLESTLWTFQHHSSQYYI